MTTLYLQHLIAKMQQKSRTGAGYNMRGVKGFDAVSMMSADSQVSIPRRPQHSASPGRALQDVTAHLQAMRLGNPQPSGTTRGDVTETHSFSSADNIPTAVASSGAATADEANRTAPVAQPVLAVSRTPMAIAADMQDIDKRLANLQHFLLQTKTPMGTT